MALEARPLTAPEQRRAAIAALRLRERAERSAYADDIWRWFTDRVVLLDPLQPVGRQVAPYPAHYPYLRHLVVDEWERFQQNVTWKSRRVMCTNTACGYFAGKAAHLANQRYYLIGRVEGENPGEGARELIARTVWMLQHLRPGPRIAFAAHKLSIEFPDTGSLIIGMGGNEPDKMRSIAANGVLCDEFPFWDYPEEAYQALRPTLEGQGKVLLVSTTAEGFFKEIVYDETDSWMAGLATTTVGKPTTARDATEYLDGFEAWTNAGNGFRVQAIDYWASPDKPKGGAWEQSVRAGMTDRAFRREYLREFNVTRGRPVFLHEWNERTMVVADPEVDPFEPLVPSLDFGYNRPAFTISRFVEGRVWQVLRAQLGHQIHLTPFMHQCLGLMKLWYPDHQVWQWAGDDAGNHTPQSDSPSPIDVLRQKFGIRVRSKHVKDVDPSIDLIRDFMCEVRSGMPCFQVARHPSTRIVIDGAKGGYRYPEAKPGRPEPTKPHDDGFYIHVWDTIRYAGLNYARSKARPAVDLAVEAVRNVIPPRVYTV